MITIEIKEGFSTLVDSALVEYAVASTLANLSIPHNTSLTVVITDDQQIQELNRQFRGVDSPTDVLSFPAGFSDPESDTTYLGDVIISYPRAATQATQGRYSVKDEILLLVIHGTLHLLGYDHVVPEEKTKMWAVQGAILNQLGISLQVMADQ
jgi:probable rRNA maturation factor